MFSKHHNSNGHHKLVLISSLLLFLMVFPVLSQNVGKIAGIVKHAQTGEELAGANIIIVGTFLGASADLSGDFFILNVPPGKYEVEASLVGFKTVKMVDVIINAGKTTKLVFELEEVLLESEVIIVTAERPDVERDKTSTSAIVRFDDVQEMPGIRDIGDVLGLAADVNDGHFRGGRKNEEYYKLQGMGIVNPLDNSSAFMPIMSGVEEVEVITSGFGAQYGNAQSGIVNISMKEGSRTGWKTRIESRTRVPGRKHFGPSAFDPNANDFLRLLMDEDTWLSGDPENPNAQAYFTNMLSGASNAFKGDTTVQLAIAQALWQQTKRDIGRTYGQELDYSVETAMGGPINESMRMFLALRSNTTHPVFPTEHPDIEYQAMGNIVTDLGRDFTLRLSGGFAQEDENVFPSENRVSGYRGWLWDRITGTRLRKRINTQLGTRLSKQFSPNTFMDIKLNMLLTNNRVGATPFPDFMADTTISWAVLTLGYPLTAPDGMNYNGGYDDFTVEKTRTLSFDGSYTSQVTKSHLLLAGLQLNSYFIDVNSFLNVRGNTEQDKYSAHPFEAAAYIQDKMEYEEMIANVGLRFDLWHSGIDYFTDLFLPFGYADSTGHFDPANGETNKSPIYTRLQPRIGFSFPISEQTVFHLNYGSFMQRPSFKYIVSRKVRYPRISPRTLGNPQLKPETTNSYDIGVMQALGDGFTLDISGYYKDVKNLIQQADFSFGDSYVESYFNRDYADIRGFRISLNKRKGPLTGSINYQYGYATGKSATATSAIPVFYRDTTGAVTSELDDIPIRDILLDFDRTHTLILTAAYNTHSEWGSTVFNVKPFNNINISLRSSMQSGRPYTSWLDKGNINAKRSPAEYNTDLRITKSFTDFMGISAKFYLEIFNLFDNKTLNYDYIFRKRTDTDTDLTLQYYEQYPINDKENGIRYWWNKGKQNIFSVDQSFLIYDNEPRSYSFGIVFEF